MFEWIRLPNRDVVLRAYGGGGQLLGLDADGKVYADADHVYDEALSLVIVDAPGATPEPLIGRPFHGLPFVVPGRIEAEDFDVGGEGAGYHDGSAGNNGGMYRTLENVDIESTLDGGGGYNVGWIDNGEWLEYTIDVNAATSRNYVLTARVASQRSGGAFAVEFDGDNKTANPDGAKHRRVAELE